MEKIREYFDEFMRKAQAAFPDRDPEGFSVNAYYANGVLRHSCRVKDTVSGAFIYFIGKENPKNKIICQDMDSAVELMKECVAEFVPKELRVRKVREKKMTVIDWKPNKDKIAERNVQVDYLILKTMFDLTGPMKYRILMQTIKRDCNVSESYFRILKNHWLEIGILVREGSDRSPQSVYKLGKLLG